MPAFTHTIRFRLTVWYSSLLLVFGVAFVVALNIAVRVDRPQRTILDQLQVQDIDEWQPSGLGPGQAVSGEWQIVTLRGIIRQAEAEINSDNLDRLQTWSILAVVGLAVASGAGGYVLSGMMLGPVRDIARVASQISGTNLSKRINHEGPEDELKDLADTFDSMIDRLEYAFDSQRRFVQYASHELRTPLAAIRTNIEVTEMDPDASTEDYRDLLETVKTQTDRLTRLSDDLMLLTSTEGEPPPLETLEPWVIAAEAVDQLRNTADLKRISLRLDGDPGLFAQGHADLLYRCVFNLAENAIKYSDDGSAVTVVVQREGGQVAIVVRDTGPGIPAEYHERIFERFFRVDRSLSRKTGGSGLGLAIVKELVEAMRGTISVQSEPGVGSAFTIRLPSVELADI